MLLITIIKYNLIMMDKIQAKKGQLYADLFIIYFNIYD